MSAAEANPSRRRHGTTVYPMCPGQVGGNSSVPGVHRKPMWPQNSPSHIQRLMLGKRGTSEPSGSVIGPAFAVGSSRFATNAAASSSILCNCSRAAPGRMVSGDQPLCNAATNAGMRSRLGLSNLISPSQVRIFRKTDIPACRRIGQDAPKANLPARLSIPTDADAGADRSSAAPRPRPLRC